MTAAGEGKSAPLKAKLPHYNNINGKFSVPLPRAIQTTLILFEFVLWRGLRIIALEDAQDAGDCRANTGNDIGTLRWEMHDTPADLSRLDDH